MRCWFECRYCVVDCLWLPPPPSRLSEHDTTTSCASLFWMFSRIPTSPPGIKSDFEQNIQWEVLQKISIYCTSSICNKYMMSRGGARNLQWRLHGRVIVVYSSVSGLEVQYIALPSGGSHDQHRNPNDKTKIIFIHVVGNGMWGTWATWTSTRRSAWCAYCTVGEGQCGCVHNTVVSFIAAPN